jgi:hypothetical protein
MNDRVATESQGHPASRHERKLGAMIRDQGRRTSSGPAATAPRQQAGHMTAADQTVQSLENACQSGPSTYDGGRFLDAWGADAAKMQWTPGELFGEPSVGRPGGLVWQLAGESVSVLCMDRAQFSDGRTIKRSACDHDSELHFEDEQKDSILNLSSPGDGHP